jgi:hypothetical protein
MIIQDFTYNATKPPFLEDTGKLMVSNGKWFLKEMSADRNLIWFTVSQYDYGSNGLAYPELAFECSLHNWLNNGSLSFIMLRILHT